MKTPQAKTESRKPVFSNALYTCKCAFMPKLLCMPVVMEIRDGVVSKFVGGIGRILLALL